ncbi:MAG: YbjN domain-containing protein [Ruminococcaceae bacterium]|nr:YbjN domain-containing protein [Oscillospiraceae bacterium]
MLLCAEKFIDRLKEDGMVPDVSTAKDGAILVDMKHQGKEVRCIFRGDEGEYFTIFFVYESIPAEKKNDMIVACNDINAQYKWVKAYVDSDNDLIYQVDAKLSPDTAAEEALEMVLRTVHITDEIKPRVMKAIYA